MMNCPECGEEMTFNRGHDGTRETLVAYFSPPGHDHDDNCLTRIYRCKNGHVRRVSRRRKCPICDWVGRETCFCHPDKKVDKWPGPPSQLPDGVGTLREEGMSIASEAFEKWFASSEEDWNRDRYDCQVAFLAGWHACDSAREQLAEADPEARKVELCRHGYPPGMWYICK